MSFTPTPEERMERLETMNKPLKIGTALTMTEEEYVNDPSQRALLALDKAMDVSNVPARITRTLFTAFQLAFHTLTEGEMRAWYKYAHECSTQEPFEREADELLRDRQEGRR